MNPTWIERFDEALATFAGAAPIARPHHRPKVLTAAERLLRDSDGVAALYERIVQVVEAGMLEGTTWEHPERLVPGLVEGTLRAGGEPALMEVFSELRMLALAEGRLPNAPMSPDRARDFLEQALVASLDLVRSASGGSDPADDDPTAWRAKLLFEHILAYLPLDRLERTLGREVALILHQRPIVTLRARTLLRFARERFALDHRDLVDRSLLRYLEAIEGPTALSRKHADPGAYARHLERLGHEALRAEADELGRSMRETGLVAPHLPVLLRHGVDDPSLLARAMNLREAGRQQLEEHRELVAEIITRAVHPETEQSVYGLAGLLDQGLLSRGPVRAGLTRLSTLDIHPDVAADILHSVDADLSANAILLADTLSVLSQPLGVRQGWSPTCQSARGIALWSHHAPGKLLDMVITVAQSGRLEMRFEGATLDSSVLPQGLQTEIDYRLDAVSTVLVPHLDRIYNEMMRRGALRDDDPHKWVNPALYGHWIPTGFRSAFDQVTQSIYDYEGFVRTFYASHHPQANGGHDLAYPSPVGLFITSAQGDLLGFHAVSLLRVAAHGPDHEIRAYFFNPNAEGQQDWGQGVLPSVYGHGERAGESSLPFAQFVARLYAFHYNPHIMADTADVDDEAVADVQKMAHESWGSAYAWAAPIPS